MRRDCAASSRSRRRGAVPVAADRARELLCDGAAHGGPHAIDVNEQVELRPHVPAGHMELDERSARDVLSRRERGTEDELTGARRDVEGDAHRVRLVPDASLHERERAVVARGPEGIGVRGSDECLARERPLRDGGAAETRRGPGRGEEPLAHPTDRLERP